MAILDDGLRAAIGNAYAGGDYANFNNLLTQNNISADTLKQSFNLGDSNLANATSAGTLTAYNNQPTTQKFSDPGFPTQPQFTGSSQPSFGAPPNLRDMIGQMYQNQNYSDMQKTINQYGLTADWAKQNYGLSDGDLSNGQALGINFQGNPSSSVGPATPSNSGTPATSLYPTLTAPQPNINGSSQAAGPLFATPAAGSPDWMKQIVSSGGQAYRDPNTGFQYLPHFSTGGDNPSVDGYRVLDPSTPTGANGLKTFKVLDSNGNDTGKTEQMGYPADWFTSLMPLVIGGLATFGIGSTIAGIGAAAGAGAGTDAMSAAAASDAGGGSLGGAAPGLSQSAGLSATPGVTMGADGSTTFGAVDGSLTHAADGLVPGTGLQATAGTGTNLTGTLTGAPGLSATAGAIPPLNAAGDIGSLAATTGAAGLTAPAGALTGSLLNGIAGGTGSLLGTAAQAGTSALSTGLSVPASPTSGGQGPGGITPTTAANGLGSLISGLTGIATAIQSGNAQKDAANNMLDWLKTQQAKIDNLYQPGSPEYNLLMQQMAAKDAAAGRNSQYGVRSVDLAAKIAQIKAQYTAQLTAGIAGNMSSAFNQSANSNAGLDAILGNLTKPNAQGQSTLSNIVGQFF